MTSTVVLSQDEVRQVLTCLRRSRYRICLSTLYTCGLHLNEGVPLQVKALDGARQRIHVRHGKGAKNPFHSTTRV